MYEAHWEWYPTNTAEIEAHLTSTVREEVMDAPKGLVLWWVVRALLVVVQELRGIRSSAQ